LRLPPQGARGDHRASRLPHPALPADAPRLHPGHGRDRGERSQLERMARRRGRSGRGAGASFLLHLDSKTPRGRLKRAGTLPGRAKTPAGPSSRSLWMLFAVALLVRIVHVLAMRASPYFTNPVIDAATYDDAARAIAAGHGHPDVIFWQPPGYSYFLAFIYSVAGPGYLAPRIAQALLGAGSAVLTAWIGARDSSRALAETQPRPRIRTHLLERRDQSPHWEQPSLRRDRGHPSRPAMEVLCPGAAPRGHPGSGAGPELLRGQGPELRGLRSARIRAASGEEALPPSRRERDSPQPGDLSRAE